jgi:hypothetical protein
MSHPSDLGLEQHLQDPTRHAEHVAGCERCKERLARMEEEGRHFHQFVYPATLEGLEQAPRRSWRLLLAPAGLLAAAALVLVARRPDADYVGTKGGALKLTVYAGGASGARPLADGEPVPASAALRFKVQTSAPCVLTLLSVDDSGQVSRIYGPAPASGEATLPGGAVLDGRAGRERFFAICSPEDLPAASLHESVRAAGVRGSALQGLPPGSTQASLLLEKKP